jgi:hypothetical protein
MLVRGVTAKYTTPSSTAANANIFRWSFVYISLEILLSCTPFPHDNDTAP